jgi:hypothetical protein
MNKNIINIIKVYLLPCKSIVRFRKNYCLYQLKIKTYDIWSYLEWNLIHKNSKIRYDRYWYYDL